MAYKLNIEGERLLEEMQIYSCTFCNVKIRKRVKNVFQKNVQKDETVSGVRTLEHSKDTFSATTIVCTPQRLPKSKPSQRRTFF